jgi:hypothetical protein
VRVVDLARAAVEVGEWRLPFVAHRVSVDRRAGTWRLFGSSEANDIVTASGSIRRSDVSETRWRQPGGDVRYIRGLAVANDRVLALESRFAAPTSTNHLLFTVTLLAQGGYDYRTESRLWTIGDAGFSASAASRLNVQCEGHQLDEARATCTAYDGSSTGFFAVDPATLQLTPMASVDGRFYLRGDGGLGSFFGWWNSTPVLWRPDAREIVRVAPREQLRPDELAISETTLAASWSKGNESTVRLYPIN